MSTLCLAIEYLCRAEKGAPQREGADCPLGACAFVSRGCRLRRCQLNLDLSEGKRLGCVVDLGHSAAAAAAACAAWQQRGNSAAAARQQRGSSAAAADVPGRPVCYVMCCACRWWIYSVRRTLDERDRQRSERSGKTDGETESGVACQLLRFHMRKDAQGCHGTTTTDYGGSTRRTQRSHAVVEKTRCGKVTPWHGVTSVDDAR